MKFDFPERVTINKSRWQVDITIEDKDGHKHSFVASADSGVAESGIFFGTQEEYNEAVRELW